MKRLLPLVVLLFLASMVMGCSSTHIKVNMTQIKEKYSSISSMSGTAIVKKGSSKDTVIFTFVKPDSFLEWYSTKNKIIVYNGSFELIRDSSGTRMIKTKIFNPYNYGKILNNSKAYVQNNSIVVENKLGKIWLNRNLLPEKIEWSRGITIKIVKLNINGRGDERVIEDFMGTKKSGNVAEKANKLVSLSEAEKEVNFNLLAPVYTGGCKFVGAIVSNVSGVKVVTLYYGEAESKKLLTVVETTDRATLNSVCGIGNSSSEITVKTINVNVGKVFGKWSAYEFELNNLAVVVYGNLPSQEMVEVVSSMIHH